MRSTLLALSLAALTIVAVATRATAQDTKTARGTVSAMSGTSLTVTVAGTAMNFMVDDKTVVEARGAGTAANKASAAGKAGPKLGEVVKDAHAAKIPVLVFDSGLQDESLIVSLSSGARTMPSTFLTMKSCMTLIWPSRSSSSNGPFQRISMLPSSFAAFSAPAWTDFQNSCVVPFGITANANFLSDVPTTPCPAGRGTGVVANSGLPLGVDEESPQPNGVSSNKLVAKKRHVIL